MNRGTVKGGRPTSKAMTTAIETVSRRFSVFRFLFFSGFLLRHAISDASIAVKLTSLAFLSRHGPFSMRPKSVSLLMGKGFSRAKNKQAELAKKLANSRQQQDPTNEDIGNDDDIKMKERELFDKLLTSTRGAIPTDMDTDSAFIAPIKAGQGAKKKIQKPKPTTKPSRPSPKEKKEDEKIAQRQFFEALLDMETSKVLGPIGAAQLVPWVPPYLTDCLVVFADPRASSWDLRQTLKYLISNLNNQPDKFTQQIAFITADSIPEMSSWLQRSKISTSIRIFCDPDLKFMTSYDLAGNELDSRWSMSMLVFDTNGKNPDVKKSVDPTHATQMTLEIMREYEDKT